MIACHDLRWQCFMLNSNTLGSNQSVQNSSLGAIDNCFGRKSVFSSLSLPIDHDWHQQAATTNWIKNKNLHELSMMEGILFWCLISCLPPFSTNRVRRLTAFLASYQYLSKQETVQDILIICTITIISIWESQYT